MLNINLFSQNKRERRHMNADGLLVQKLRLVLVAVAIVFMLGACGGSGDDNPQTQLGDDPDTDPADPDTDPVDPDTDPVDPDTDPVDPDTDPVDPDTDPVDPDTDPVDPDTDPVDPDTDPVDPDSNSNLVTAAGFPTTDVNGQAQWAFAPIPSELEVHVQPFVEMPLAGNGAPGALE